jgi:CubicO group peptidase (beta-lactamase class C family)
MPAFRKDSHSSVCFVSPARKGLRTRRQILAVVAAASCAASPLLAKAQEVLGDTGQQNDDGPNYGGLIRRAESLDQLHSVVIANGNDVLFERRFRGPRLDATVNVKSVSKTIVALLTGIAVEREIVGGVDASIGDLIPDLIPDNAPDTVGEITISDLLTMRAGLERTSGPNYGAWVQSDNWVHYILSRPIVAEPGRQFLYSTGSYHLLGVILSRLAGKSLHALATEWLGEPIGIEIPPWQRDPQGFYFGGNNMALRPAALARIGQVVSAGGSWDGKQVISKDWIANSWRPRTRSPFSGHDYGFGWFLTDMNGVSVAYGRGYGGQMLYVAPDLGLTAAITSDPSRPARSQGYAGELHRLFAENILSV